MTSQSFVIELPIAVDDAEMRTIVRKLEFARQLHNATLGTAMGQLQQMRDTCLVVHCGVKLDSITLPSKQSILACTKQFYLHYPCRSTNGNVRRVQEEKIKSLITLLEDKLSALSSSYLNISGKPYYSKAEDLLTYDSPSKREQSIEASSLAESLYEITEFHERFLSFMKALVYDGTLECMLPLSA